MEISIRPEDLREFTRQQPFVPYRIHITGGQAYDIRHPDQVIVLRSPLVIGFGGDDGIGERLEPIALIHVVRIEELPSEASSVAS